MTNGRMLLDVLRDLDPEHGRVRVGSHALNGFAEGLRPLLGTAATVLDRSVDDAVTQVILAFGPDGAVVCLVQPAPSGDVVDVTHSVDVAAVRAVGQRLDPVVELRDEPVTSSFSGHVVTGLLGGLEAAAAAARRHAAERLHDGPLQELTVAQLLLESAVNGSGGPDAAILQRGVDTLRTAIASSRRLMSALLGDGDP